MLLKQYEKFKKREFELDLLRELLGIRKDQYGLYSDFRKRVLLSSQKELSERSDIYFDFEEVKCGRRVGAIRFHIFTKKLLNTSSVEQVTLFDETTNTQPYPAAINAENSPLNDELL